MSINSGEMSLREKKLLLAQKLKQRKSQTNTVTDSQKALWYIYASNPDSNAYNQYFASKIKGNLNVPMFKKAFEQTIYKHTELRARFREEKGNIYKAIDEDMNGFVMEIDAKAWSEETVQAKVNELVNKSFALEEGKLFRVYLLIREVPVLVIVAHHIVIDLWSMGVIIQDMNQIYTSLCRHQEVAPSKCITYTDYTIWQEIFLKSDEGKRQKEYWMKQLGDYTQVVDLAKKKRVAYEKGVGKIYNSVLDKALSDEMRKVAKEANTTLYVVFMALYNILLYKYIGNTDIVVGSSVAGRNNAKYKDTVGYFVNLLPIRNQIESGQSFLEYVQKVKQTVLESLEYQEYPFSRMLEDINVPIQTGFSPLVQVAFSMEMVSSGQDSALFAMGSNEATQMRFADLILESMEVEAQDAPYDLLLKVESNSDRINLSWQFNAALIEPKDIEDMARQFRNLIAGVVYNRAIKIKDINILDEVDYKVLFETYNPALGEYDGRLFLSEFNKIAKAYSDHKAVTMGNKSISYKELDEVSEKIACYLNKIGVIKEQVVGVCLDKSIEVIEILVGILKAGGVYTPIDPSYPEERIKYIMQDSKMKYMIAQTSGKDEEVQYIGVSELIAQCDALDTQQYTKLEIQPHNAAYLIYTSGSTGKPKGVLVEHIGICNMVDGLNKGFGVTHESNVLQFASLSFDASVAEIFVTLLNGAQLIMGKKEDLYPGIGLETILKTHKVTEVILTPSVLKLTDPKQLPDLKTVMSAGESCSLSIIKEWAQYVRFINAYGPTESTVCATLTQCDAKDEKIHIGKAIKNTRIYILDKDGNPVPPGMKGELCIGSIGLARGYLNNEKMTQEKFIDNKIDHTGYTRIYRTGDCASFLPDGNVNFIGRIDNQVKIRGFRIELDEIESCLSMCDIINEAAVVVKEDAKEAKKLVAFISIKDLYEEGRIEALENTLEVEKIIKDHVRNELPHYMMPSNFVFLYDLPHNMSKKIDKNKLKAMELNKQEESTGDDTFTPLQLEIRNLWVELLETDHIQLEDNFLELGGHSLLLVQLIGKIRSKYNINISIQDIYSALVLKDMCELIESKKVVGNNEINPMIAHHMHEGIPVTYAQRRLLFLEELGMGGSAYNISGSVSIKGDLDIDALKKAFDIVVKRHDVLRTTFKKQDDTYVQVVAENVTTDIKIYKPEVVFTKEQLNKFIDELNKEKFDLLKDLLIRANLIVLNEKEYILNFSIHHSIGDGLSVMFVTQEWSKVYEQIMTNAQVNVNKNEFQYADFAIWQQENIQGKVLDELTQYWAQNLKGTENKYLNIETDYNRPQVQKYTGASVQRKIPSDLYNKIKSIARQTNTTVYMVMLAAFNILLYKQTGEKDINIGTPIAGRSLEQTQDMIGMFINTVVIRSKIDETQSLAQFLKDTRQTVTNAMNHQDMPFEKLVEHMNPNRSMSHSPLFQVMFNMLTVKEETFKLYGLETKEIENETIDSKYDFTLYVNEDVKEIHTNLTYNTSLFTEEHMLELLKQYEMILSQLSIDKPINEISLAQDREEVVSVKEESVPLLRMFSKYADKLADQEAIKSYDLTLTYKEVDELSTALAYKLRLKEIGKGKCVAIYTNRCGTLPIAMLAALKCESDFAIIDSSYPAERLKTYMEELHMDAIILCDTNLDRKLVREIEKEMISTITYDAAELQYDKENLSKYQESIINKENDEETSYYYTFTSGTTGKPQLIKSSIRSISHFINWYIQRFALDEGKVFAMLSGLAHDPIMRDVFTPLCSGGSLCICSNQEMMVVDELEKWLKANEIEVIHQTPSLVKMLKGKKFPSVKQICLGGEILDGEVIKTLMQSMPQAKIINCYGASETPQIMAYYVIDKERDLNLKRVPIGKGIEGVEVYVMNSNMQKTGAYELGEIYIRSPYISEGYVNNKELTDKKFKISLDKNQKRNVIFKTGDIGYQLTDGNIICIGRKDKQVKIRGFRVEIDEIKQKIIGFKGVKDVRIAVEDEKIMAYIVVDDQSVLSKETINNQLRSLLPVYMLPNQYIFVDEIPVTPNGKTDYRKLAEYAAVKVEKTKHKETVSRHPEIEDTVLDIWKELLGKEDISIEDNFFDIGGHSLKLVELHEKLTTRLGIEFEMLELFKYPNIKSFLDNIVYKDEEDTVVHKARKTKKKNSTALTGDIAVIGMSGRFPMSDNIDEYWRLIKEGKEAITYLSDEQLLEQGVPEKTIKDPKYVKAAMLLNDYDKFDASFFDMTPKEAEIMDPQQKLFMEECYHALENAGYNPDNYDGRIGVFGGNSMNSYMIHNLLNNKGFILQNPELTHSFIHGNINDYLCTRVAYKLNLRGPAVNVQSACSTSMTAVHLACESLHNNESDMVLVGGVTVKIPHIEGYQYIDGGIFSKDGHCRPFDDNCTGTIFGSGVGVVVLKRLEDAIEDGDEISAVIKGTGINNDGNMKVGFTASSISGESDAIRQAIEDANIDVEEIGYLEAHGTGTRMGDPIEIKALDSVYKEYTDKTSYCAIGSVKANIGHLNAASGIASLIKAILVVKNGQIPPSINCDTPNREIDFAKTPFYINHDLRNWQTSTGKRVAGVSSFGMGGTNVHVILENYCDKEGGPNG